MPSLVNRISKSKSDILMYTVGGEEGLGMRLGQFTLEHQQEHRINAREQKINTKTTEYSHSE